MTELSPAARGLGALLAGERAAPAVDLAAANAAVAHGVGPLLYQVLTVRGAWHGADPEAREVLAQSAREAVVIEALRQAHLERVVAALLDAGVAPLLFKGAALAHTHYPQPWLRVRGDTDILVRADARPAVDATFARLGAVRVPRPAGRRVTQQARYTVVSQSLALDYDVHWRIADPHVFADTLPYDGLWERGREGFIPGTRCPGDADALLIACLHRAAHHFGSDHVLLLHDIHLVSARLTRREWQTFCDLAAMHRIRAVCRRGLALAAELFGTPVAPAIDAALAEGGDEPSAAFVASRMTKLGLLRSDLRALPGWRDRIGLLIEHAFPSRGYLRQAGADGALPLVYLTRLVRGLNAWRHPL